MQQLGSDSVIVKWRPSSDAGTEVSSVCFGTDMAALPADSKSAATITATGHQEVLLSGLQPDTLYYYSVGAAGVADAAHQFRTAPAAGQLPSDGNVRIVIIGDSGVAGTGKPEAGYVRDGFMTFLKNNGDEPADLFLMLGDNAYDQGTDVEHQLAIFDVYPALLASTSLWPTIGNHEMGTLGISMSSDSSTYAIVGDGKIDPPPAGPMPYLNIFSLPAGGEIGGLASGTEQYYSFDYGNLHVVSLDSQLSIRDSDSRAVMLQWLKDDLQANNLDWTIVIFHHPPYTKGSHDSDRELGGIDLPIFLIREEFTPVFEQYGVDLAYSGHSHIYERSKYINGNVGLSEAFNNATMAELTPAGEVSSGQGDEAYTQITRSGVDDKVVYTVAGNGGKITSTSEGYPHPAHFFSELALGSVVIDVDDKRLEASFVGVNGEVLDSFVMTR